MRRRLTVVTLVLLACTPVPGQAPAVHAGTPVSTLDADRYCKSPGVFDQSCLVDALAHAGAGATVQLGPHVYTIGTPVVLSGLHGLHLRGAGESTVLVGRNLAVFSCKSCSGIEVDHLRFASSVTPTLVRPADLPTRDPAQIVAIDRFGSGHAYIPRENDGDILPSSAGGRCRAHCLSDAQSHESIDVQLSFFESSHISVHDVSSRFGAIYLEDVKDVYLAENTLFGSNTNYGCIAFWRASRSSANNHRIAILGNQLSDCTYSGLSMTGEDFVVADNIASYNGESGIKTYQGDGYTATHVTITGNVAHHNWYDGFDTSTSFPHDSTRENHHVVAGNLSYGNRETGYTADGRYVTFAANTAYANQNDGALLDLCYSTVAGNMIIANNTAKFTAAVHQMLLDWASGKTCPGGSLNKIVGNYTDTDRNPGNGLWDGGLLNTFVGNRELTGSHFWGDDPAARRSIRRANSDVSGNLPDTSP